MCVSRSARVLLIAAFAAGATAFVARPAAAQGEGEEPWFFAINAGVSGPLNDPPVHLWNVGGSGSFSVYRSLFPELAVGSRMTVGGLSEGHDLPQIEDPGVLDYGFIGASARYRPFARLLGHHHGMDPLRRGTGLFIDFTPGLALLDGDVIPAYETGIGYNFEAGPVAIGPNFRFTHFIETNGRFGDHHVLMWTGGLEVVFLDQARAPQPARARTQPRERQAAVSDRDNDFHLDENDDCPDEPEVWNGFEDGDGCPDEGVGQFQNDALVVDERVFFDFDSSDLRPTGAAQLDLVVSHYRAHGERYEFLEIGGHTDARGAEPYNQRLSAERARAVVRYLSEHGVPENVIRVRAFGEEEPAIARADNEFEHQVNRRVEFRVEWREGMRPEGNAPVAMPTMPDYVDEAPAAVQERERRIAAREERRAARIAARERARGERETVATRTDDTPSEPIASAETTADERRASLDR